MQPSSFLLGVSPDTFRPKLFAARDVQLEQASVREHLRCRALWLEVGHGFWTDRTRWTARRWRLHLRDSSRSSPTRHVGARAWPPRALLRSFSLPRINCSLSRLICLATHGNVASVKVPEKVDMAFERE
jgi:hypothetical protein